MAQLAPGSKMTAICGKEILRAKFIQNWLVPAAASPWVRASLQRQRRDFIKLVGALNRLTGRAAVTAGQYAHLGGKTVFYSPQRFLMSGPFLFDRFKTLIHRYSPMQLLNQC
jgi:hypothetical protein